jgi:SAM-dependent methyltransferase
VHIAPPEQGNERTLPWPTTVGDGLQLESANWSVIRAISPAIHPEDSTLQTNHYAGPVADWYDDWLSARRDDIDFYSSCFTGFAGTFLELACGTGRILLPIALAGVNISGLDASDDMLRLLRSKAAKHGLANIQIYHQPMEAFSIGSTFDAIFAAGGSFQLLTEAREALSSLRCILEHLKDGGSFVADIFIPWDAITKRESDTYHVTRDVMRPNDDRSIVLERFTTDLSSQLKLGTYRYEFYSDRRLVSCITDDLAIRWYWKDEFAKLLDDAGFANVQMLVEAPLYKEGHSFVFKATK